MTIHGTTIGTDLSQWIQKMLPLNSRQTSFSSLLTATSRHTAKKSTMRFKIIRHSLGKRRRPNAEPSTRMRAFLYKKIPAHSRYVPQFRLKSFLFQLLNMLTRFFGKLFRRNNFNVYQKISPLISLGCGNPSPPHF